MNIRYYRGEDLVDICIVLETLKNSKDAERFEQELMDIKYYQREYLVKKIYDVIVAFKDSFAGFMIGQHTNNDIYDVITLYVLPQYRRCGVALELKKTLTEIATEKGYKKIVSQIRTDNHPSIRLNEEAGWRGSPDKVYPDYYIWYQRDL